MPTDPSLPPAPEALQLQQQQQQVLRGPRLLRHRHHEAVAEDEAGAEAVDEAGVAAAAVGGPGKTSCQTTATRTTDQ